MSASGISPFIEGWLASESADFDKISVKRSYIDINDGNFYDGLMFSQIMYWHGRNLETGKIRLSVQKEGFYWLAKAYGDWWDECRICERTAKNCTPRLRSRGLIITKVFKFQGKRTLHIRIDWDVFEAAIRRLSGEKENENLAKYRRGTLQSTGKVFSSTETTSTETISRKEKEINQYLELTQESECAIAEEFSHSKEDSLTKKKEARSRTIQQSKSTLDEAKTLEIKTPTPQPPSPRVDRPTKKSKNPLDALTEDKDGWLVAPTKGTYKLAGIITLRRMQYAIASTFLDESYEFEFNEDGELEAIFKGETLTWQEFEEDHAIGKLRNIALHDQAASGYLNAEWWDETLKEFFLEAVEFCKRSKDALTVSRSQPASVLFGDIEPDEDAED